MLIEISVCNRGSEERSDSAYCRSVVGLYEMIGNAAGWLAASPETASFGSAANRQLLAEGQVLEIGTSGLDTRGLLPNLLAAFCHISGLGTPLPAPGLHDLRPFWREQPRPGRR